MKRRFNKDYIAMANKQHIKRYSTVLSSGKMQIKITVRYCYTPIRMAKIKAIVTTPNIVMYVEKLDLSYISCGNVKWYSHYEK